jgi:hypothetical protein
MIPGLDRHVPIQTWCLPHEIAVLTTPYSDIEYGLVGIGGSLTAVTAAVTAAAILRDFNLRCKQLAKSWDDGRNVIGLS